MPGDTGAPHHLPYNEQDDKPPNLEAITKPLAEQVHERLDDIAPDQLTPPGGAGDKGKLLVVDNTGAAAFQAMKGDATIAADGTISIGPKKITPAMLVDLIITTAKLAGGSVTLAKLAEGLGLPASYLAATVQAKLNFLRGRIKVDGTILAGTGFTAEKIATGNYKIKFDAEFANEPVVLLTASGQNRTIFPADTLSPKKERNVGVRNKEGAAEDSGFEFLFMEP